ncbi:hypothetical protein [Microbacterium sp. SA39]|uniref:hypothetical protein n=1 Tax=Microbacterium sp. SA39 TaxID=1263625 RepID=UPI00061F5BD4|nr:hypothetical protein [Microbacterium sp. SA39]KJQ52862.1 hypothetical protein RS85_03756 [Microbacterium sp. SA39]
MSGGLEIDHGGAIAVDTEAMRDVGTRISGVASHLEEARAEIRRAHTAITSTPGFSERVDTAELQACGERVGELRAEVEESSAATLLMADAFEVVELRAEAEALAHSDSAAAQALLARASRIMAADGRIGVLADRLVDGTWRQERFTGLGGQWDLGGLLPQVFLLGAFVGVTSGVGTVLPGMTLKGEVEPVTVAPVRSSTPAAAPATLRGAFERMPSAASAQVAVEKLTFADGTTKYMVYVKGTQNMKPWEGGGAEPWDMKSNAELYTGEKSASYQATLDALAAAGAAPGDTVGVVAHSQAGMIAVHLGMESEYDVDLVATAGSPVGGTFRADQLVAQLAHTDDVFVGLTGGGSPGGTGSADSFTATRVADPDPGFQDVTLAPHKFETYLETAQMVDESGDPRVEALDEYWAELGKAVSVERTEYHAERTSGFR